MILRVFLDILPMLILLVALVTFVVLVPAELLDTGIVYQNF